MKTENPRIILGSSSPYRRELLLRLQLPFTSQAPNIDETPLPNETAVDTAIRLAKQKGEAIANHHQNTIIITSDQVATVDNQHIGKPGNHEKALQQLQFMRGKEVIFHTALCVTDQRPNTPYYQQQTNIQTFVKMRDLSDTEFDHYLHIEQPYDCAGSAKNEGLGIALLSYVKSDDPTALTGLPLIALTTMLRNIGVHFFNT